MKVRSEIFLENFGNKQMKPDFIYVAITMNIRLTYL